MRFNSNKNKGMVVNRSEDEGYMERERMTCSRYVDTYTSMCRCVQVVMRKQKLKDQAEESVCWPTKESSMDESFKV